MIQRIYRIVFLLFIAAGAVRLSAQMKSSEIGVWVINTEWKDSKLGDGFGAFDDTSGQGIAFNRYWTERFSTELSAQRFGAQTFLGASSVPVRYFCGFGELPGQPGVIVFTPSSTGKLNVTAITALAQMHFNRAGRVAPYVGAGVSHLSADFDGNAEVLPFDVESDITWAAAAGLDVRITDRVFLTGELRYIPWSAIAEGAANGESLNVEPLALNAGVKVRF